MSETPSCRVITTPEEMRRLESQWRLLEQTSSPNPYDHMYALSSPDTTPPRLAFQSFDWCLSWVETFTQSSSYRLHIVVVCEGEKVLLIWPLMLEHMGFFKILRWLSFPLGQYGDVLTRDPKKTHLWMRFAWQHLRTLKVADTIHLRHVLENAVCHSFVTEHYFRTKSHNQAPFLIFSAFKTEEDFQNRFDKKQRQRRKKIHKKLETDFGGPILGEGFLDTQIAPQLLHRVLEHKRTWLEGMGFFSKALAHPLLARFFITLSRKENQTCHVFLSQTSVHDKGIAWEIGLRHQGTHYCFITAHDPVLTEDSPARLHMDYSQTKAFQDGVCLFDLLIPSSPHKLRRSNGVLGAEDFYCALTWKGVILGHLSYRVFKPLVRRTYYALPPRLRAFVLSFFQKIRGKKQ